MTEIIWHQAKRDGLWYLAHPYSIDPKMNVERCILVAVDLIKLGYRIVAPIVETHRYALALKAAGIDPEKEDPDFWYKYDAALMSRCDGIILAGDWRNSKGCMLEYGYFLGRGDEVLLYDDLMAKAEQGKLDEFMNEPKENFRLI